ncbi:MAG: GWxTD domain-containing protein [Acidobacteriota bacterium]|nr:GWxTD domain-containing protein [Acidobacteriota bacterium]
MPKPSTSPAASILALLLVLGAASGGQKVKPESLAPAYQEWLKLTTYVMTDKEKAVFLELANDRERDIFIEAFWRIRDPTPGTPANEFKEEHLRRVAEANRRYRGGSTREGWMTDRGRMLIILGTPATVETIGGSAELVPTELWSYYGDPAKGLPNHFVLVFYQRGGAGEYRLYDPWNDGPSRLLVQAATKYDVTDYEGMYERIYELQPDLALVSLSLVPGQIPFGFQPSMEAQAQMTAILESPKRAINDGYATHFLNYRGVVSTEYLTNVLEGASEAVVLFDPLSGLPYAHFAMAPQRLSLDYYEPKNEYYCVFQMDVSLRAGGKIIYQYSKDIPINVPADRLPDAEDKGIVLQDTFPVVEGSTKLTVLFRNPAGKEFAVLEKDLEVPSGMARLAGPVLGYGETAGRKDAFLPFQAGETRLHVDPKMTFAASDEIRILVQAIGISEALWTAGSVRAEVRGLRPQSPVRKEWTLLLKDQPRRAVQNLGISFPAAELSPDYYDLTVTLLDGGGAAKDVRTGHFVVSPEKSISHPIAYARTLPRTGEFLHFYDLAGQYARIGAAERAEALYAKARSLNPGYTAKIPEYAAFLIQRGKPEQALTLIEAAKDDPKLPFSYFHIKGRALLALGRLDAAAAALESANRVFNSDTALLGDLGRCYARMGRTQEALTVLRASLKLNPDQPEIKDLADRLAKK